MRKTLDQTFSYPEEDPSKPSPGQYRLRIYEDESAPPVVVATDLTLDQGNVGWLAGRAPHLAGTVAQAHLTTQQELRWMTPYEAEADKNMFAELTFAVLSNRQVAYHGTPRPSTSPPLQSQSRLRTRADVETLIGEKLD